MQKREFQRQAPAVPLDKHVHPARIRLDDPLGFWIEVGVVALGRLAKAQQPELPINTQRRRTKNSESCPRDALRSKSICQSRSCAMTYPCASARSVTLAAVICGTPQRSRSTVTSWLSPGSISEPSILGNGR